MQSYFGSTLSYRSEWYYLAQLYFDPLLIIVTTAAGEIVLLEREVSPVVASVVKLLTENHPAGRKNVPTYESLS